MLITGYVYFRLKMSWGCKANSTEVGGQVNELLVCTYVLIPPQAVALFTSTSPHTCNHLWIHHRFTEVMEIVMLLFVINESKLRGTFVKYAYYDKSIHR